MKILSSCSVLALCTVLGAQRTLHTFYGDAARDAFGLVVAGAGDVDDDGFADLIVGAPLADGNGQNSGVVQVYSGRDGSELYSFAGSTSFDAFGQSVAGVGDVDGDGCDDLGLGWDQGTFVFAGRDGTVLSMASAFSGRGKIAAAGDVDDDGYADFVRSDLDTVSVVSGRNNTVLYTWTGAPGDEFGSAIAGAGDWDGDGYDDVIVGARRADNNGTDSGRAVIFSGRTGGVVQSFYGTSANNLFGWSVAGAGDVDDDGFDDVIIGARGGGFAMHGSGSAWVLSGRTRSRLYVFEGESVGDAFGHSVDGAGDVNADGYPDLIVGAPNTGYNGSLSGSAYVYSGRDGALLARLDGDSAGDALGIAVAGAGDVDCDGLDDVIVGAYRDDDTGTDAGSARVVSLRPAEYTLARTFVGPAPRAAFGRVVAIVGDIDADGCDDVLVGSPIDDTNGVDSGRATLFSGKDGSVLRTFLGQAADDRLGQMVARAGDVNRDGTDDYLIGAPGVGLGGDVTVYSGTDGRALLSFAGRTMTDGWFGWAAAGAGDIDGDGFDDLVVGSYLASVNGPASGSAFVFSGRDGSQLHRWDGAANVLFGDSLGWAVAGAGDVDGDGCPDVIVGAPQTGVHYPTSHGYVNVYSGRTGALLRSAAGDGPGDLYGYAVAGVGDVDGDGLDDVVAGAPFADSSLTDIGVVELLTANGAHRIFGASAGERFGGAVAGVGDIDGDRRPDFAASALAWNTFTGRVTLFEGDTRTPLQVLTGDAQNEVFGTWVDASGDVNGDGVRDLLVGVSGVDQARLFTSSFGTIGRFKTFGTGCPGSNGKLPHLDIPDRAVVGNPYTVTLRTALPSAPCAVQIDVARTDIDLSIIGFAGCRLFVLPFLLSVTTTNALGRASRTLRVPNDANFLGAEFFYQWVVLDFAAARVAHSEGGALTIGWR